MMKTFKTAFLLLALIAAASCFEAKGQVTIGSGLAPLPGVLLDIKTSDTNGSSDATGGLKLPRVELQNVSSLEPLFTTSDNTEKAKRAGLMVYNVSTSNGFKPGVYVWDGAKWNVAGGGVKWFYAPSFNIEAPTTGVTGKTVNLYDEYKNQFLKSQNTSLWKSSNSDLLSIPSPDDGTLYEATDLDYVITYYDNTVFNLGPNPISSTGVLTYSVPANATITDDTYFNIIFVVR
jgi:hypothetical protein